jgi:hypothetical protein
MVPHFPYSFIISLCHTVYLTHVVQALSKKTRLTTSMLVCLVFLKLTNFLNAFLHLCIHTLTTADMLPSMKSNDADKNRDACQSANEKE